METNRIGHEILVGYKGFNPYINKKNIPLYVIKKYYTLLSDFKTKLMLIKNNIKIPLSSEKSNTVLYCLSEFIEANKSLDSQIMEFGSLLSIFRDKFYLTNVILILNSQCLTLVNRELCTLNDKDIHTVISCYHPYPKFIEKMIKALDDFLIETNILGVTKLGKQYIKEPYRLGE